MPPLGLSNNSLGTVRCDGVVGESKLLKYDIGMLAQRWWWQGGVGSVAVGLVSRSHQIYRFTGLAWSRKADERLTTLKLGIFDDGWIVPDRRGRNIAFSECLEPVGGRLSLQTITDELISLIVMLYPRRSG